MYMVHFTQILEIVYYSAGYMIRAVHMLVLSGLYYYDCISVRLEVA